MEKLPGQTLDVFVTDAISLLCGRISPKNTTTIEDIEDLSPVKFRRIPFSGCRGEVENVSINQMPGWLSLFTEHRVNRGRGHWVLASSFVEFQSVTADE